MADPTRPVQDAVIDPVWGQWVHDNVLADGIPNSLQAAAGLGGVVNGMLAIAADTVVGTTNASGFLTITFPFAFTQTPVVVVSSGYDSGFSTFAMQTIPNLTNFVVVGRNVSGGNPLANNTVRVNYIAIGRRS